MIETGHIDEVDVGTVERVARALDADLDWRVRWRGGDLDRLMNARHAALHERVARLFQSQPGWIAAPEVSFSIYGERGIVDLLAFHPASASLVVVELKTELVDVQELIGNLDRKRRLAPALAVERDWPRVRASAWVILPDTRTNRRHVETHSALLRSAYPTAGRAMAHWLQSPVGIVAALSFLPTDRDDSARRELSPVRRVRARCVPVVRA